MKQFTASQTASIFGVSTRTLERWRSSKKFVPDSRTVGGHSRYSEEQIEAVLGHGIKIVKRTKKAPEINLDDLLS